MKYNIHSGYSDFFSNIKYCKNKNIDIFPVHIFVKQNTFFWSYYQVLRITFYPDIWSVKNHSPLWDPIAVPTARYSDKLCTATALSSNSSTGADPEIFERVRGLRR